MKKLIIILVALVCMSAKEDKVIKIACIGDSITYGARIDNREQNSYPAQLATMLGEDYIVENFGVSSTTMLRNSDKPYIATPQYQQVFEFKPDIIYICLGTNDSKGPYQDILPEFKDDYKATIKELQDKMPNVKIVLMTPIQAYNEVGRMKIDKQVIKDSIVPMVKEIAFEQGLEIIDMQPMFGEYKEDLMPDQVHPSAAGATLMALRINEFTKYKKENKAYTFDSELTEHTNFHGYKCYDFNFEGRNAKIVEPKIVAPGKTWVWRTGLWGEAPQVDVALLERGFHVVYLDTEDLFGSDTAVEKWEQFYSYLTKKGLSKQCAIEALGSGALVAYNYAARNPKTVSVIYADSPVLSANAWNFKANKDKNIREKLEKAYNVRSRLETIKYGNDPLDNTDQIANAGFDILHIYANTDSEAPADENTKAFAEKVQLSGGNITVIEKKDEDADSYGFNFLHPRGLVYPDPAVRQILQSTNLLINAAAVPTPGYRNRGKFAWYDIADEITDFASNNKYDILLLGNSITHSFASDRKMISSNAGKAPMDNAFPNHKWLSAGISADRTQHLLHRILYDGYEACQPKYVIITIGINNFNYDRSTVEETIDGIIACVDAVRLKMPESQILLFGTLPAQKHIEKCAEVAKALKKHKFDKQVTYVDTFPLLAPNGETVTEDLFNKDLLHVNVAGYEVWTKLMTEYIK